MSKLIQVLEDKTFSTPAEIQETLDITLVVANATDTGLEGSSVDLFVSNNTLEHIPYPVLLNIFGEFRKLAAPAAIISHYIDLNDHFALFDSSISPYHFFKLSSRTWRLIDNQFSPVNRLRISDYRTLHESAGFDILSEEDDSKANQFNHQAIAKEFQAYPLDDLIVTDSWMISTPVP